MKDRIYDKVKVQKLGTSTAILIPKKYEEYLGLEKGDIVELDAEKGKHGKYMTLWKKKEE